MTPVEYMKRKNELIMEDLGVILIPDSQISNVAVHKLGTENDADSCPYCHEYIENGCYGCPMSEAKNRCGVDDSTYDMLINSLGEDPANIADEVSDIYALVYEYNKSNGFI